MPAEQGQQQRSSTYEASQRSLYRRHRPRTFADVVGQDSAVRTLRNAVEQRKVHHAYLFVGSRGTGKTSMAKILAACLNCERGPTTEPCGSCDSCRAIAEATSLDVIEMDAASNNSVEDIRELRERIALAPVSGRHKVYILDEAHMLSQPAWNAFLKTLEEPPQGTVFVLATTEAQKVPATVVDRCHRFDFHRASAEQIAAVIRRVAHEEQIDVPPEAVAAIARAAQGSFRDALGTLEQLVTYSGNEITVEDALAVLGVVDSEALDGMLEAIARADAARVLLNIASSLESGQDAGTIAAELEARARDLLVVGTLGSVPQELSLTPEADARLSMHADAMPRATVVRLLELLAHANEAIRAGADARTQLELALVKAASPESDDSATSVIARLERLEAQISGDARNGASAPVPSARPAPAPRELPSHEPEPHEAQSHEPDAVADAFVGDLEDLREQWPKALDAIRAENALLGALIAEAQPVDMDGDQVTLAFAPSAAFLKRKAEDRAHYATVAEQLRRVTGRRVRLAYELREGVQPPQHTPAEEELVARLVAELDAEELPAGEIAE